MILKNISVRSLPILMLLLLSACSLTPNYDMVGMFYGQSPRSDARFEQSMAYNEEHNVCRTIDIPADDYMVYICTDIHVDSTWRNISRWTEIVNASDCEFALVLGDLINAQDNFPHFMQGIKDINKTLFCTAGNHDLYFGQWAEYFALLGSSTYYFIAQTPSAKDLYICLDSSDGTLGNKQLKWLKNLLKDAAEQTYRHIIVFTHTHLFKKDNSQGHTSNFTLEETYEITDLLSRYGVDWYLSGHAHSRNITDFKGVKYIIVDTMQDPAEQPTYMITTVGAQLRYEFVDL